MAKSKRKKSVKLKVCPRCYREYPEDEFTVDHIIPRNFRRQYDINLGEWSALCRYNRELVCKPCNLTKGDYLWNNDNIAEKVYMLYGSMGQYKIEDFLVKYNDEINEFRKEKRGA